MTGSTGAVPAKGHERTRENTSVMQTDSDAYSVAAGLDARLEDSRTLSGAVRVCLSGPLPLRSFLPDGLTDGQQHIK